MRIVSLALTMLFGLAVFPLHAQQEQQVPLPNDGIRNVAPVVVEGEQPGPGLWIVRNGNHDLYLLPYLYPLPTKMQWRSGQVRKILADAQEIIYPPQAGFTVKTGFFSNLGLLPMIFTYRNNPDSKHLQDVVSAESYARWLRLKERYIGNDSGVEKMRPMFAAQALYAAAMKKNGLDGKKIISPVIEESLKAHHPVVTKVEEWVVITDPKPLAKVWKKTTLDDLTCFDNTMTRIEADIESMRLRANAWATGDVAALRTLKPPYQWEACNAAMSDSAIGKRIGLGDADAKVKVKWLAAVDAALGKNAVTFAALPWGEMFGANGYLAKLQTKGYTVIAPDDADE